MRAFARLAPHFVMTAGICFAATAPARGAGEAYDIRLQRPYKVGQNFTLSATDTLRSAEKVDLPNGASNKTSTFRRVILDADIHIDNVDDKGAESQATLTIRKLTLQSSDADQAGQQTFPNALLDPNTQVLVFYGDGQTNVALKKAGILSDDATIALKKGLQRMSLNDAIYGTKEKKKVGDTWPLNKTTLPADRSNPQFVDPSLISGTVTFKALRALSGIDCMQIEGTMTSKDFQVQGIVPKETNMTTLFTASLPVDLDKPIMAWNVRSTTHFVTEEKPLGQGIVRHTVDSEIVHEATLLPK